MAKKFRSDIEIQGDIGFKNGTNTTTLVPAATTIVASITVPNINGTMALQHLTVPYTGATTDVDLGAHNLTLDKLVFNTGAAEVVAQGQIAWNADEETMDVGLNGAVLQMGQELHYHVRNNTISTITDGTPVMVTGTIGTSGRITIAPMVNNGTIDAHYFLGIATEDISADDDGKISSFGKIREIQTDGVNYGEVWLDGDLLYLSATTPGYLTKNVPAIGAAIREPVAFIIKAHAAAGTLSVRVTIPDPHSLVDGEFNTPGVMVTDGAGNYSVINGTEADIAYTTATVLSSMTIEEGIITAHSSRALTPADIGAATSGHQHTAFDYAAADLSGATVFDNIDVTNGIVTAIGTRELTLADLGYTGSTTANNYSHPAHPGDDISLDTGALSGATVISDIDFNITTDTQGHVTDATLTTLSTRNLTAANIGAAASSHNHDTVYVNVSGDTMTGDLTVGATTREANTFIRSLSADGYTSGFEAYGASQGTGYCYVGQSATHGGGMFYNGDGTPAFATGETVDRISFYRRTSSVNSVVFSYSHNADQVDFKGVITAPGGSSTEWNTAYDLRSQWSGTSTGLTASTGRSSLGLGGLATLSTVNAATITDNSVGAAELNVSGNGTTAQYLRSDADGTMTWATPTNTVYSHPAHPGDDINVDTGALTGATVVSDIDINVTTDALGHVTDANGVVATRTLTLANLGYTGSATANNYVLPLATTTVRGGIEIFSNTDNPTAANAVTSTASRTYGSQLNAENQLVVNVPWTDTNTVYTHPTHPGDDASIDTGTLSGASVISRIDFNVTTDTLGHVTDVNGAETVRTLTLADLGYTGSTTANNYSLPQATSTVRGGVELFSDTDNAITANAVSATAGRTYGIQLNSANQMVVNVPWVDTNTNTNYYLSGITHNTTSVTFTVSGTTNRTLNGATTSAAGVVTNGTQSWAGAKTFTSNVSAPDFVLTSDRRVKDNISPLVAERSEIEFVNYEHKALPGVARFGVIAQDVQKTNPELVRENEEGELSVSYIDLLVREVVCERARAEKAESRLKKLEDEVALIKKALNLQ